MAPTSPKTPTNLTLHCRHLPQIEANEHATIAAIVDNNPTPSSPLAIPPLVPLAELETRYSTTIFASLDDLFASDLSDTIDGVLICTPHATHTELGLACIERGLHVMMEVTVTKQVYRRIRSFFAVHTSPSFAILMCPSTFEYIRIHSNTRALTQLTST